MLNHNQSINQSINHMLQRLHG